MLSGLPPTCSAHCPLRGENERIKLGKTFLENVCKKGAKKKPEIFGGRKETCELIILKQNELGLGIIKWVGR